MDIYVWHVKCLTYLYFNSKHGPWAASLWSAVFQDFDFTSTPINLNDIRERIALFIVEQIIDENGEFHCSVILQKKGDEA